MFEKHYSGAGQASSELKYRFDLFIKSDSIRIYQYKFIKEGCNINFSCCVDRYNFENMDKAAKSNKQALRFFCICNKSARRYGTTTALHTHVKQKHKGDQYYMKNYKDQYDEYVMEKM